MQPYGTAPAPRGESIRLMDVAGMRERHLDHRGFPGSPSHGDDDAHTPVQDGAVGYAPPAPEEFVHDPGQLGEPRRSGLALSLDGGPRERCRYIDHPAVPLISSLMG